MPSDTTFEGLTEAQRCLVEYWLDRRDAYGTVARAQIDPGALRAYLSCLSIVEVDEHGCGRFRIAGSGLQRIFGLEARGRCVADVVGERGDALSLTVTSALDRGVPIGGVIEAHGELHAWLRLPLLDGDGNLTQVLCHDALLKGRKDVLDMGKVDTVIPMIRSAQAA